MSRENVKFCDEAFRTLSNKIRGLISSHFNINVNFDHKLKELNSLILSDQLEDISVMKLNQYLIDLHSMLDMKLRCAEEVNLICYRQCKAFLDFNHEFKEYSNNCSDEYSDTESINGEMSSKSKTNEAPITKLNPTFLTNRNDVNLSKKLSSVKCADDSFNNVVNISSNDTGPVLRKKLNFNMKPSKHKAKKFISYKKQNIFKNESNLSKKSNSIRVTSNDSKYSSFNKKHNRLSISNSLLYSKRTRNHGRKSARCDREDTKMYCICNKPSYGDMIACDSDKCQIEWFHYKCVDITTSPKGDWFCPMCKME